MAKNTRPKPPSQRGEAVVVKILDAAVHQLAHKGYHGLTFEDVAKSAGVAKTTVYRRWPTKAALIKSVIESTPGAKVPVADSGNLREDLLFVGLDIVRFTKSDHGIALMRLFALHDLDGELRPTLNAIRRARDIAVISMFERARSRGEIGPDVDIMIAMEMLPAGIFLRATVSQLPLTREYVESMVSFILQALDYKAL